MPSTPEALYQAEYSVEFAVGNSPPQIAGPCAFEQGEISIKCEHGGAVAFDPQVATMCQQADKTTMVCDMTNLAEGAAYVACSGSSKEQLSISVVWTPGDRNSLRCQDELGVMSRTLWIGQQCPLDILVSRPQQYLMSADDSAVSCYPFQSSNVDIIEVVMDGKRVFMRYEVCSLADAAVFAEDEAPMTKMMAKILPNHVVNDCVSVIANAAPSKGLAGGFEAVKNGHGNKASVLDLVKDNNNNRPGSQNSGKMDMKDEAAIEALIDLEREIAKNQIQQQESKNGNVTGGTYHSTDFFEGAEAFAFASSSSAQLAWGSGMIALSSILCLVQVL